MKRYVSLIAIAVVLLAVCLVAVAQTKRVIKRAVPISAAGRSGTHAKVYLFIGHDGSALLRGGASIGTYDDAIPALRYSYDVARESRAGAHTHGPVVVTKKVDATSPKLFGNMVSRRVMTDVTVIVSGPGADGKEELRYLIELDGVVITKISQQAHSTGHTETIAFDFEGIEVTWRDERGAVAAGD